MAFQEKLLSLTWMHVRMHEKKMKTERNVHLLELGLQSPIAC